MNYVKTFESFLVESVNIPDLTKDAAFRKFVKDEFGEGYEDFGSAEELNDGYCILVAKYLNKKFPNSEVWTIGNPMVYHVATKIGNKFYDAVNTEGVDSLADLSWAKGIKSPLNPKKGIVYDH